MTISIRRNDVVFSIAWTLVTTISLAFAGFMFHYPSSFPSTWDNTANLAGAPFGFIIGALSGLLLGLPQWILLRRSVKNAKRWLLTTSLGIGIMHSIGDAFPFGQYLLSATVLSAIVMSMMQQRILRDVLARPYLWMVVSIIGWVLGYFVAMAVLNASGLLLRLWTPSLGAAQHALFGAAQGVVYAVVTSVALITLRKPSAGGTTQAIPQQYPSPPQNSE